MYKDDFMRMAIRLSVSNAKKGGGPFGAVIVKNGKVIASGVNNVIKKNDPTAHAEIEAVRKASKFLKSFDLSGCELYTSCEPCPMCLSAIYWANIKGIFYGNTRKDAANIGFIDDHIYKELKTPLKHRSIPVSQHLRDESLMAFKVWQLSDKKTPY